MIEAYINTNISFGFVLNDYALKKKFNFSKKCVCYAAFKMHVEKWLLVISMSVMTNLISVENSIHREYETSVVVLKIAWLAFLMF